MTTTTDFWDPRNPVRKADRLRFFQRKRLVIGLCLDSTLTQMHGCLLQGQGAGKALRVAPLKTVSVTIPDSIRTLLAETLLPKSSSPETLTVDGNQVQLPAVYRGDLNTLQALQFDLTLFAEGLIDQLKAAAGQATDKILAVCLSEPGLLTKNDDQTRLLSLLDAQKIAFQTSMNVIDQLPGKDMLSGGYGWPLNALPLWMIWADRRHPKADQSRLILDCDDTFLATLLPPSDGLDAEYPEVQQQWLPGLSELLSVEDLEDLVANPAMTTASEQILQVWNATPNDVTPNDVERDTIPFQTKQNQADRWDKLRHQAKQLRDSIVASASGHEIAGSLMSHWLKQIEPLIDQGLKQSPSFRIVIVDRHQCVSKFLTDLLTQEYPQILVSTAEEFQCESATHSSMVAATMAFLHIDQMPSNLPWLTGTDHPRILGSLTPGSPTRYRNLLVEMADYRPPVMKLRDAV